MVFPTGEGTTSLVLIDTGDLSGDELVVAVREAISAFMYVLTGMYLVFSIMSIL